jgi:hypothetical protein
MTVKGRHLRHAEIDAVLERICEGDDVRLVFIKPGLKGIGDVSGPCIPSGKGTYQVFSSYNFNPINGLTYHGRQTVVQCDDITYAKIRRTKDRVQSDMSETYDYAERTEEAQIQNRRVR